MNKKELIESLIELQATEPGKNFSLKEFLAHSGVTEWNVRQEVGRYGELQVAAGIKPNRASREFTNKTVLHNSTGLYKGLNKEAQGLDKRYVRKDKSKFKT